LGKRTSSFGYIQFVPAENKYNTFKILHKTYGVLYIYKRLLQFSNSKTKVKVSPINGMPFPIGLVYINNDLKK
jgi:hypothetical protein